MRVIFLAIAVAASFYILIRRRRFDFFAVSTGALLIYFFPAFLGYTHMVTRGYFSKIPAEVYAVMICILTLHFTIIFIYDASAEGLSVRPINAQQRLFITHLGWMLLLVATVGLVMLWIEAGKAAILSLDKRVMKEAFGRWYILFIYPGQLAYLSGLTTHERKIVLLSAFYIIFSLFLGDRTPITLMAVATLVYLWCNRRTRLITRFRLLLSGLAALALVLIYKRCYLVIKRGDWGLLMNRLADPNTYHAAIEKAEPFNTFSILNEVIRQEFTLPFSYLKNALITLFSPPYMLDIMGVEPQKFHDLYRVPLFGPGEAGLAANIWAEMYSVGGVIAVSVFAMLWSILIAIGSYWYAKARVARPLVLTLFAYLAFYIQRNDLLFMVQITKRFVIIWIAAVIACLLFNKIRKALAYREMPNVRR